MHNAHPSAYDLIRVRPRDYQIEAACFTACSPATILCMPTGSGKTLVAALSIIHALTTNPHRCAVFMAKTHVLVEQQHDALTELCCCPGSGISPSDIVLMYGAMQPSNEECDSIASAPPKLLITTDGFFVSLMCRLPGLIHIFSLLVLDEVHHAAGKGSEYRKVLHVRLQLPVELRPAVLGLTASPAGEGAGGSADDLNKSLKKLKDAVDPVGAQLFSPVQCCHSLDANTCQADLEVELVEPCEQEQELGLGLQEAVLACLPDVVAAVKASDVPGQLLLPRRLRSVCLVNTPGLRLCMWS